MRLMLYQFPKLIDRDAPSSVCHFAVGEAHEMLCRLLHAGKWRTWFLGLLSWSFGTADTGKLIAVFFCICVVLASSSGAGFCFRDMSHCLSRVSVLGPRTRSESILLLRYVLPALLCFLLSTRTSCWKMNLMIARFLEMGIGVLMPCLNNNTIVCCFAWVRLGSLTCAYSFCILWRLQIWSSTVEQSIWGHSPISTWSATHYCSC